MFYVFHWQNITPSDADIYINCQKYKEIQRYIPKNTINTSKSISENVLQPSGGRKYLSREIQERIQRENIKQRRKCQLYVNFKSIINNIEGKTRNTLLKKQSMEEYIKKYLSQL